MHSTTIATAAGTAASENSTAIATSAGTGKNGATVATGGGIGTVLNTTAVSNEVCTTAGSTTATATTTDLILATAMTLLQLPPLLLYKCYLSRLIF